MKRGETMGHQMAFPEFWTIEEIAEYIVRTVDRGNPLDLDIVKEWNHYMTEGKKDANHDSMQ